MSKKVTINIENLIGKMEITNTNKEVTANKIEEWFNKVLMRTIRAASIDVTKQRTTIHYEMKCQIGSFASYSIEKIKGFKTREQNYGKPQIDEEAVFLANEIVAHYNELLNVEDKKELVGIQRIEIRTVDLT